MKTTFFFPLISSIFFVLSTSVTYKITPVWMATLVLISGFLFFSHRHPSSLPLRPLIKCLCSILILLGHTLLFSHAPLLSLMCLGKLSSFLLMGTMLHLFAHDPFPLKPLMQTSVQFPFVILSLIVGSTLLVMEAYVRGHHVLMDSLSAFLALPLGPPRTLKPYIHLLSLAFFVFLTLTGASRSWAIKWVFPLILGIMLITLSHIMESHTNTLAFITSSLFFFVCFVWPKKVFLISRLGISASFVLFPGFIAFMHHFPHFHARIFSHLSNTIKQRLIHWLDLLSPLQENWLTGYGLGGSKIISSQVPHALFFPHNMILEFWLDLGIGGACAAAFFSWRLLHHCSKYTDPLARASGFSCILFFFIINQTSYSNLHFWWMSAACLASFWISMFSYRCQPEMFSTSSCLQESLKPNDF